MSLAFKKKFLISSMVLALTACGGEEPSNTEDNPSDPSTNSPDTQAYSSIFSTQKNTAAVTTECGTAGGFEIHSGFDLNENKTLDTDEIDKTFVVCNGTDGVNGSGTVSAMTLDGTGTECTGVGGTKLIVGDTTHLMCNADPSIAPAKDFDKARLMVNGLSTWVANLEHLGDQVASLEEDAKKVEELYGEGTNADGVGQTISALSVVIKAMTMINDEEDGTYQLTDIISDAADDFSSSVNSTTGSFVKIGSVVSLSEDLTVSMNTEDQDTGTTTPVAVKVDMDDVTLPANSGTDFSVSLNNVVAESDKAKMTSPVVGLSLTTENSVNLNDGDPEPGNTTMTLQIGNDTTPANLTTKITNDDVSAITFNGQFYVTADMEEQGLGHFTKLGNLTGELYFMGELAYDGKSVEVDLGLVVDQRREFDYEAFTELGKALNAGGGDSLIDYLTIQAEDVTTEAQSYDSRITKATKYSTLIADYVYDFSSLDEYVIYEMDGVFYTAGYYYDYLDPTPNYYIIDSHDTLDDATQDLINLLYSSYNYDRTSKQAYMSLYFEDDLTLNSIHMYGSIDFSGGLPEAGETTGYTFAVDDLDYDDSDRISTFENHDNYTLTAGLTLTNIPDGNGGTLPEATLRMKAERWGSLGHSGEMKFTLSYGDESFSARYRHNSLFDTSDSYNQNESIGRANPIKFSFTDNEGGLLIMDDFALTDYDNPTKRIFNCDHNDDYPDEANSACVLGSYRFHIYYNGLDHGVVSDHYPTGDWLATYYDGVEERIYEYKD